MREQVCAPSGDRSAGGPGGISEDERNARFAERMEEERGKADQCMWLSFCDPDKPKGEQFLGVVIMWAPGLAHAIDRAWKLGINPGGQVLSYVTNPAGVRPEDFDRLLTKAEIESAGYC